MAMGMEMNTDMQEVCEMIEAAKLSEAQWKLLKRDLSDWLKKQAAKPEEKDTLSGARIVEEDMGEE